jgi:hypothetical protein
LLNFLAHLRLKKPSAKGAGLYSGTSEPLELSRFSFDFAADGQLESIFFSAFDQAFWPVGQRSKKAEAFKKNCPKRQADFYRWPALF